MKLRLLFLPLFFTMTQSVNSQCSIETNDPCFMNLPQIYNFHNLQGAWDITCGSSDQVVAVVDVFSPQIPDDLDGKIDAMVAVEPF